MSPFTLVSFCVRLFWLVWQIDTLCIHQEKTSLHFILFTPFYVLLLFFLSHHTAQWRHRKYSRDTWWSLTLLHQHYSFKSYLFPDSLYRGQREQESAFAEWVCVCIRECVCCIKNMTLTWWTWLEGTGTKNVWTLTVMSHRQCEEHVQEVIRL